MIVRWKLAQYFELIWWKAHLRKEDKTEYLRLKRKYWERIYGLLSDELQINEHHTILDLGCGPSGIYMLFDKNKVTAVDPLLEEYEKNLHVFSKTDYPNSRFIKSKIEDYNDDSTYDVVFCMNAINHVSNIQLAYEKLDAFTKNNGKMIVSIDAHNYRLVKYIFNLFQGDILHPHQYNLQDYIQFAEANNFNVQKSILIKKGGLFNHYLMFAHKN